MVWAGEKTANIKTTTLQDIFSDVIGHYPVNIDQTNTNPRQKGKLDETKNWSFELGLQRYLMSHTSYDIGDNAPPYQELLSRLEFPLDTWWLRFELRRTCPRWSLGLRSGLSVARNIDGRMEDSDWTDPNDHSIRTIYSQSACRAEANYLFRGDVDVNISDWLGLPPSFEIRPLFAFQFQRLSLMAHDGVQWWSGNSLALPGDSLHFRQDYYLYLIGLRGSCDLAKPSKYITIKLRGEADWGAAAAYYEDHHLKREGDMFAYCNSYGNALYFSTGLDFVIAKDITAGVTMDYLGIRTAGATKETNIPLNTDSEWWSNGVKVWSDQTSLSAHVSYAF